MWNAAATACRRRRVCERFSTTFFILIHVICRNVCVACARETRYTNTECFCWFNCPAGRVVATNPPFGETAPRNTQNKQSNNICAPTDENERMSRGNRAICRVETRARSGSPLVVVSFALWTQVVQWRARKGISTNLYLYSSLIRKPFSVCVCGVCVW